MSADIRSRTNGETREEVEGLWTAFSLESRMSAIMKTYKVRRAK